MSGKIITISRQYGSGGRDIGRKAAEKLGLKCYDKEIISEIAARSGYAENYVKEQEDAMDDTGFFGLIGNSDLYTNSSRVTIWTEQCNVIKQIAEKGPCVIVGRCADYVLAEQKEQLMKVFIYADTASRARRVIEEYKEPLPNPEKGLRARDKRRAAYYEIYTDQKYGDPVNYDFCLNSGSLGIDTCVDYIVAAYKNEKQAD
jgi:cytidylate kinase